jgi:hypothetical protein
MRRPALTRPTPSTGLDIIWSAAADPTWAHPYAGRPDAPAVFYNDGGDPTPAPAPAAEPPKPGPPPAAGTFTQDDLDRIAAREKAQGARSGAREALEKFAADNGFSSVEDAKAFIEAARQAKQDSLSEDEKRRAELDQREQQLNQRESAAKAAQRNAERRLALVSLGSTGDALEDAIALLEHALRDQPDADTATVTAAATALKERRGELFGAATPAAPVAMPPAPGGAPAGGGTPARPTPTREDINERERKRAVAMGFRRPAA